MFRSGFSYTGTLDDNIFADDNNKESSYVSQYSPDASLQSNWGVHALNFRAIANISRNHKFSSEDTDDWTLSGNGRLDIDNKNQLYLRTTIEQTHVIRTSPNEIGGLTPTLFTKSNILSRYVHKTGLFSFNLSAKLEKRDYEDVLAIRLGQLIILNNDSQDRNELSISLLSNYTYSQGKRIFVKLRAIERDYDQLQDFTNFDRSSKGQEILFGLAFDTSGIILGDFSLGYRTQDYEDPYPDINKPIVNASIDWNISYRTTIGLDLDRSMRETISNIFSGYIETSATLSIDHELRRNLLINASLLFINDEYAGIGAATREDDTFDIIMGSTYRINRNMSLAFQYQYLQREATINTTGISFFDFKKNLVFIQLQAQL